MYDIVNPSNPVPISLFASAISLALSRCWACRRGSPVGNVIMTKISYAGYRFPPVIIQQAIWLYVRFSLSFRDVEDLLAERGITVSYETVRRWVEHFGSMIAADLRRRRPKPHSTWHLDEVFIKIDGRLVYLGVPSMLRARSSTFWCRASGTSGRTEIDAEIAQENWLCSGQGCDR